MLNPRNIIVVYLLLFTGCHTGQATQGRFLPRDVFIVHLHFELPLSFIELRFTEACLLVNKADYYIFCFNFGEEECYNIFLKRFIATA